MEIEMAPENPQKQDDPLEILVGEEAYEQARRQAIASLDQQFHLGGAIPPSRDKLHER
jgi:hypothetical protein